MDVQDFKDMLLEMTDEMGIAVDEKMLKNDNREECQRQAIKDTLVQLQAQILGIIKEDMR